MIMAVQRLVASITGMAGLAWQANRWALVGDGAITLAQGLLPLGAAWVMKSVLDLVARDLMGDRTGTLIPGLIAFLVIQAGLSIASQICPPISAYLAAELGRRLRLCVELAVLSKVSTFVGIGYSETPRFYDTISLASQGAQFGPQQCHRTLTDLLRNVVVLTGFLVLLVSFSPSLAWLVVLSALPRLVADTKLGRLRSRMAKTSSPKERELTYYGVVLSGGPYAREVCMLGLAGHFLQRWQSTLHALHAAQRRQSRRELHVDTLLACLSSITTTAAFAVVVSQAIGSRISIGDVSLYLSAVGNLQSALGGIIAACARLNEGGVFYGHFLHLLSLPQPIAVPRSPRPIAPLRFAIEMRSVSFRYPDNRSWVLQGVDFAIPAGKCVALVGDNGAGKSTLVKLLTRLYDPTDGHILWDGIDIREFDPAELRREMAVAFQDFMQYDLKARENIGLGNLPKMDDLPAVQEAARLAGIHDVLAGLPEGYETMLSLWFGADARGHNLSRGEWQKLVLARLFISDASLIIMDEPTSSLDAKSETETIRRSVEQWAGRTCLIVSHRFSTTRAADLVAVLHGGRITEYGSHDCLLALGGAYSRLYTMQSKHYR